MSNMEHGSFTPLVFSSYGGSGSETERWFMKELAEQLANKHQSEINVVTT